VAIEKRYDEQMPFVGTRTMKEYLDEEADRRRTSIARIIRDMIDERYLLDDGDDLPPAEKADLAEMIATRARRRPAPEWSRAGADERESGSLMSDVTTSCAAQTQETPALAGDR
jgi:hypothetical protein